MKGMVFAEFLEMVEDKFSMETAEAIIEASDIPSGGAYTSVGIYDHREIIQLVIQLSAKTGTPVPELVRVFGRHLFHRFSELYGQFFQGIDSALDFLQNVDGYIHVEVRKLYPEAELPRFDYERPAPSVLHMTYSSSRPFADLAEGLILGCIDHFGENITLERQDLSDDGRAARFTLTRQD